MRAVLRNRRLSPLWIVPRGYPGAGGALAGWVGPMEPAALDAAVVKFTQRQTRNRARMTMADNHDGLMALYHDVLGVMEDMLARTSHLFGEHPALADFGLYGQLSQCAIDPSASAIMRAHAPRTYQWTQSLDDTGGIECDWAPRAAWQPSVQRMLQLAGRLHLPLLLANHAAVETEQPHTDLRIDGRLWRLPAQRCKQKCLVWLQRAWQAQASIHDLLADSGCLDALATPTARRVPVPEMAPS